MTPVVKTEKAEPPAPDHQETVARMADCMQDLGHCGADRETLKLAGNFSDAELDACEREAAAQAHARTLRRAC